MWKHVKTCEKKHVKIVWNWNWSAQAMEMNTAKVEEAAVLRRLVWLWRWCGRRLQIRNGISYIYIYTYVFTLLDWFEPIHRKWASFVSGCFGRYCRSCWIMMDIYIYIHTVSVCKIRQNTRWCLCAMGLQDPSMAKLYDMVSCIEVAVYFWFLQTCSFVLSYLVISWCGSF